MRKYSVFETPSHAWVTRVNSLHTEGSVMSGRTQQYDHGLQACANMIYDLNYQTIYIVLNYQILYSLLTRPKKLIFWLRYQTVDILLTLPNSLYDS